MPSPTSLPHAPSFSPKCIERIHLGISLVMIRHIVDSFVAWSSLYIELQGEVVAQMDALSKALFSMTSREYYKMYSHHGINTFKMQELAFLRSYWSLLDELALWLPYPLEKGRLLRARFASDLFLQDFFEDIISKRYSLHGLLAPSLFLVLFPFLSRGQLHLSYQSLIFPSPSSTLFPLSDFSLFREFYNIRSRLLLFTHNAILEILLNH